MTRKMVWVKWHDSHYLFDQHSIEAAKEHKVAIFETVGHLVSQDSDRLIVALDLLPASDEVRGVMAIPVENIVKKKIINLEV